MRYLRDITKDMERIMIREMEISSEMEGMRLGLMEAQSKLKTRESEMGKVRPE